MKRSNLNKWLAALRSGKYEQLQGALMTADGKQGCCLGVYMKECGPEPLGETTSITLDTGETRELLVWKAPDSHQESGVLTLDVVERDGWRKPQGQSTAYIRIGHIEGDCLSELNDRGASFEEIAHLVEAHPEWFFTTIEEDV